MASRIGILRRSGIMEGTKVSTASAEFIRRWKNTTIFCSREIFEKITREYAEDLRGMRYEEEWVARVLMAAIKGYCKILDKAKNGMVRRNRSGKSTRTQRRFKKLVGPSSWFQRKPQEESEPGKSPKGTNGKKKGEEK